MDRFLSIEAFVTVAKSGSFAEAARQMRVSKSVITTRVQQLEDYVSTPLFHRNTRNVRLSEFGLAFFHDCSELVCKTDCLVDQMREHQGLFVGQLKIHALPGFVLGHLAAYLCEFQEQYRHIVLDLFVSDMVVDPIKAGVDCSLQIFHTPSEDIIARKIFPVRRVFCASPAYLERHGVPADPRDLHGHRIGLYSGYPTRDRWLFHREEEKIVLDLKPALRSNSVHLLKEYALEGAGIVCIPTLVASESIQSGALHVIIPNWQLSSFWLSIVYPRSHRGGAKLRLFAQALQERYAGEPPWDRALTDSGILPRTLIDSP
ncbi:LysR family transcriptional regulator [Massilia sp. DWR3-1-1]|uniref:LysR family transcriptional regulator n=1 Tax=Massilia sp. DWR3-1-1 TaxID=2804559 RepID=UPI003CEC929C